MQRGHACARRRPSHTPPFQHHVRGGPRQGWYYRLHTWLRTAHHQGQERAPGCGEWCQQVTVCLSTNSPRARVSWGGHASLAAWQSPGPSSTYHHPGGIKPPLSSHCPLRHREQGHLRPHSADSRKVGSMGEVGRPRGVRGGARGKAHWQGGESCGSWVSLRDRGHQAPTPQISTACVSSMKTSTQSPSVHSLLTTWGSLSVPTGGPTAELSVMKAPTGPPPTSQCFASPPSPSHLPKTRASRQGPRDTSKPTDKFLPFAHPSLEGAAGARELPQMGARPGHSNRKAGARGSHASPTANAKYSRERNFC